MKKSLSFLLYNIIIYCIQPLIWFKLLWRGIKTPAYCYRLSERYGFCKGKVKPNGIILHAASVGEVLSAVSLVHSLRNKYPTLPINIVTVTHTGSEQIKSLFVNDNIYHVYLPYDLPGSIKRFLVEVNPVLVIIIETELWPNFIKNLFLRKVPIIIANARLSFRSYINYKKIRFFIVNIIKCITLVAAQSKVDGVRFIRLGLKKKQLVITGNIKFDISLSFKVIDEILSLRYKWGKYRQIWIAASTHKGEENILLQAHRELLSIFPDLLLILIPRHPERFFTVLKIVEQSRFNYLLYSTGNIPSVNIQVVIGDIMGKLMLFYGIANLAFIGGSLIRFGGHNPLEAAIHAIPILTGPYTFNFYDICNKLKEANALITVTDISSLVDTISMLLLNDNYRFYCGLRAFITLHQYQGALQHLLNLLEKYL